MKQTLLLSACCGLIGLNSAIADDYTPPGGYYSAPGASNAPYNSYQQPIGGQPQSLYGNPGYVAPRSDYGSANQDDRGIHINPMNMMNRMFGSSNQRDDYGRNDRYYAPPAQYDRGNNYGTTPTYQAPFLGYGYGDTPGYSNPQDYGSASSYGYTSPSQYTQPTYPSPQDYSQQGQALSQQPGSNQYDTSANINTPPAPVHQTQTSPTWRPLTQAQPASTSASIGRYSQDPQIPGQFGMESIPMVNGQPAKFRPLETPPRADDGTVSAQ